MNDNYMLADVMFELFKQTCIYIAFMKRQRFIYNYQGPDESVNKQMLHM